MRVQSLEIVSRDAQENISVELPSSWAILPKESKDTIFAALLSILEDYFHEWRQMYPRSFFTGERPSEDMKISTVKAIFQIEGQSFLYECGDFQKNKVSFLSKVGLGHLRPFSHGLDVIMPLFRYFGSGRIWKPHYCVDTVAPGSQLDIYKGCLNAECDSLDFERWLKRLTYVRLQKQKEIPALTVVKDAVRKCIPGVVNFFHDTEQDCPVLIFADGKEIAFNVLKTELRDTVAIVSDIAYRAAYLNAHLGQTAASATPGIILIDGCGFTSLSEGLKKVFPNLQFIVA